MANIIVEKNKKINILINESLNSQLSQAAKRSGVSKSAFVKVALERELNRDEKLELELKTQEFTPS